jgi:hypothetical protein
MSSQLRLVTIDREQRVQAVALSHCIHRGEGNLFPPVLKVPRHCTFVLPVES